MEIQGLREPAEEKRLRILAAARTVCARAGYDAARMEEIAAEAHVSKGTLYNYFASKEELFLTTVLDSYQEGQRRIDAEVAPAADPGERLTQLIDSWVKVLPAISATMGVNFQVWGVVARDAAARKQMFRALRSIYAERAQALESTLREGLASGAFAPQLDVRAWIHAAIAVFDGFVYRSTFDPDHANPEQLRDSLRALVDPIRRKGSGDD